MRQFLPGKAAHALKGSVSNFCAQQAQQAAVRLEEIGRAGEAERRTRSALSREIIE